MAFEEEQIAVKKTGKIVFVREAILSSEYEMGDKA